MHAFYVDTQSLGVTCAYKLCELDSENDVHLFSGSSLIQVDRDMAMIKFK